jgi:hypothetical protein
MECVFSVFAEKLIKVFLRLSQENLLLKSRDAGIEMIAITQCLCLTFQS